MLKLRLAVDMCLAQLPSLAQLLNFAIQNLASFSPEKCIDFIIKSNGNVLETTLTIKQDLFTKITTK